MYDERWMRRALELAKKGTWATHPNPMVGALIVRDGVILGEGYHCGAGQKHAEVMAIEDALAKGNELSGAELYVSLEPCNHHGKMPPCTQAIINAGIAQCYVASADPDPRVNGRGVKRLRDAGVGCELGFMQEESSLLNAAYFKLKSTGMPFVTCKWAMSLDGRIATKTGHARWISCEESRIDVHKERARHDAIVVGTGTVMADNPALNVRLIDSQKQPLRVVLDRTLRIPLDYHVFNTKMAPSVLFTSENIDKDLSKYEERGLRVIRVAERNAQLNIEAVLRVLASEFLVTTLYCEGGSQLLGSLLDRRFIDSCDVYLASMIIGGKDAKSPVGGEGISLMSQALDMQCEEFTRIGKDVRLRLRPKFMEEL
ncbi:MAG: bifunctional diaminohydroxyphosphoribosylaminopyrimidine deaminase/5-amino-6-(5-phosphoribosylamino)uracil reductase RibD [Bradymonadales bacterium]|jgi:diaminohydroxyphosphoribosylaminopyrimidine deaminase/5-amino-6-(5-phosphoribosylamino)uracil reductase